MTNHPNRSRVKTAASNPTPVEVHQMRKDAGLTQPQAAAVVYTTVRSWQNWESGEKRMHPGLFELFKLKTQLI